MSDQQDDQQRRPTVADVDPDALAVSSVDDSTRTRGGGDETDIVETGSAGTMPVEDGHAVPPELDEDQLEVDRHDSDEPGEDQRRS